MYTSGCPEGNSSPLSFAWQNLQKFLWSQFHDVIFKFPLENILYSTLRKLFQTQDIPRVFPSLIIGIYIDGMYGYWESPQCLNFLNDRRSPTVTSRVSNHKGTLQYQKTQPPGKRCSPLDCLPGQKVSNQKQVGVHDPCLPPACISLATVANITVLMVDLQCCFSLNGFPKIFIS